MNASEILSSAQTSSNSISDQTKKSNIVNQDEFLKLLTYQLKSQNPLNPLDNQEFAAQLAQFSQLEQLTSIKSLMEQQVQSNLLLSQSISNSALPGLLGKNVKAISDKLYFDGEKPVGLGYNLPYDAQSGEVIIKDSAGNEINRFELYEYDLKKGQHDLTWNGQDKEGNNLPSGEYTFEVSLKDTNGLDFKAETYSYGKIQTVRFKNEGTMIVVNNIEIPLENIVDISNEDISFIDY